MRQQSLAGIPVRTIIFAYCVVATFQPARLCAAQVQDWRYWHDLNQSTYDQWAAPTLSEQDRKKAVSTALASPEAGVRAAGLKALIGMGQNENGPKLGFAVATVAPLLDDGTMPPHDYIGSGNMEEIGFLAAQALLSMGSGGQAALSSAVRGDKVQARNCALSVAQFIEDPAIVDALIKALRDPNGADGYHGPREGAYMALIQGNAKFPAKPIIAAFDDPSPFVRGVCIQALGHIGDPAGTETLMRALVDPEKGVRSQAMEALSRANWAKDDRAIEPLLEMLQPGHSDQVRSGAANTLGQYKAPRVVKALVAALQDPYVSTRAGAATSLGKIGDPAAIGGLALMVKHERQWDQSNAIDAIVQIGGDAALSALADLFDSDDPAARSVLNAVTKLTGKPAENFSPVKEWQQRRKERLGY